ncbi:MAG: DNA helicase-2/ATP-dependent DNA helicase PcrA [Oceanicoccus sp.]|jgi:DNA helicase-2/ATP-dependent DNA helicase PcrA
MSHPKLNPKQSIAVSHIEGPMMVLAGPGTGKTQIVAARIAEILEKTQMDPHNILCLTFTESGVVAMRKRLLTFIGNSAYHVRIHTFHSFCNDVIKENPETFTHRRELEALDDVARVQIFRKLIDSLDPSDVLKPFADPYLYQRDLINGIQTLKREDVSPEKFSELLVDIAADIHEHQLAIESFIGIHGSKLQEVEIENMRNLLIGTIFEPIFSNAPAPLEKKERTQLKNALKKEFLSVQKQLEKQKSLAAIYEAYQSELITSGKYDFEDMILFVVQAFKKDPALLARYQEQFQYILVDEYQDTNGAQNEVVELIANFFESPNLFVVGDDKQSIYRFQGASLENILYFYKRYKDTIEMVSLEENYRSHQGILDSSHSLIQNSEHSLANFIPNLGTKLTAALPVKKQKIEVYEFDQPATEHYFLAKKVEELVASGVNASEIAIFFRNNYEAESVVDLFLRLSIPFRLERGANILEDLRIKQLIELLRLLDNTEDSARCFQVLHYDFLGFENLSIHKLVRERSDLSRKNPVKLHLFDLMLEREAFKPLAESVLDWQKLSHNKPMIEVLDHIIRESGYLDFIMSQEDKVEHLNRLNSFFDFVRQRNRTEHGLSLKQVLEYLDLLQENDLSIREHELRTQKEAVRLMTAHKSKGLEFEHVFIMNCVNKHWGNASKRQRLKLPNGLLKNDPTASVQEQNEDERRLFYVAMTRTKHQLYLSYSKTKENGKPQVPSMFFGEIGEEELNFMDTSGIEDEALARLQTVFLEVPVSDHTEEEEDFARSLLKNYTMSITHLNNYLDCPRKFYYRNLLRVPSAMNKYAAYGSAIHETLRNFSLEHKESGLPTKESMLIEFDKQLKRQILSEQDFRGGLQLGQETLSDYYDTYKDEFSVNVHPEYDFGPHGVNLDGIPLTGKLDQVEFRGEVAHVIDYKTGNPDTKAQALAPDGDYHRQIVFYQLLCDLSPKFPYKMTSGEIQFVQKSSRDGKFKRSVIKVTDEDLNRIKIQIKDVYEDIQNLKFLDKDEWAGCGECEYCQLSG